MGQFNHADFYLDGVVEAKVMLWWPSFERYFMDIIGSFQARLHSGGIVTIRHIQKYVELNSKPALDGREFRLDTGETVLQMGQDEFVVVRKRLPHEWATRLP